MAKNNKAAHVSEELEEEKLQAQAFEDESFDDGDAEEEQIGFPPYWTPEAGRKLRVKVIALDQRDPAFWRWVLQATHRISCQSGPSEDAEPRLVQTGEFFTMSVYAALPLQNYLGCEVIITTKEERSLDGGKSLWVFSLKVSKDVKALLENRRQQKMELMRKENPQLGELPDLGDVYAQATAAKKRVEDAMKAAKNAS